MCYSNRQIDNRLKKLQDLEAQKKAIEEQIKEIQEDLKADLGDMEQVETDHFILRWTKTISNRFDSTAFKKAHEKLYKEFCKPSESRRFSYKATA